MSGKTAQRHAAHGWTITRVSMPTGERYNLIATQTANHSELPITAFYTRGRVAVRNLTTGDAVSARTPGVLTQQLGVMNAGTHEFLAELDSEWWCFDKRLNAGQLPQLQVMTIPHGASAQLATDTRALLCAGTVTVDGGNRLEPGATLLANAPLTLQARGDALLLIFDRALA